MLKSIPASLIIASRESRLALWQSEDIRKRLTALYPRIAITILGVTTEGDRIVDQPLAKLGGKGLFVKELEMALTSGAAALAVHSMKDVPMTLAEGFALTVLGDREDPRDALICRDHASLAELPAGSVVGTSSLRRQSQLRARYPQLKVEALRGNVETRLRKLDEGRYAAIILAVAGLKRLGLSGRITAYLSVEKSLPAVGQGALGIEYLAARADLAALLAPLANAQTTACVVAERSMSRRLAGSCDVPLGAYASIVAGKLHLTGVVASPDGAQWVSSELHGRPESAERLGTMLAEKLLASGAEAILAALQTNAA